MKRVTIIGSGNAFNMDGRAHTCFLLESGADDALLLDFGATSLMRIHALGIDLDTIQGLLITHFHGDHIGGIPFLILHLHLIMKRTKPFAVLGPPGVRAACERVLSAVYPGFAIPPIFEFYEIQGQSITFSSFKIQPFPVRHVPESTAYRITGPRGKTFAFSGDTAYDAALTPLVENADAAVIELSMPVQDDPPIAHVSLEEVLSGVVKLEARRVLWSHIYDELAEEGEKAGLETAHDGMTIDFP
ncbi:MAG: MBL fold metallo-hydrolase [Spirochaetia bacterium]|nr:MBL fold metallo-hydrolase [Spirochaetia bacterium]